MPVPIEPIAKTLVTAVLALGVVAVAVLLLQDVPNCSVESTVGDARKLALAEHTDIVKWGLGLSVSLVGLFGSFMLRIKDAPSVTPAGNLLLLTAMACFCFAAYFALLWRSRLGQALYMECSKLAANSWMTWAYHAHHWFFVAGLGVLLAAGCFSVCRARRT